MSDYWEDTSGWTDRHIQDSKTEQLLQDSQGYGQGREGDILAVGVIVGQNCRRRDPDPEQALQKGLNCQGSRAWTLGPLIVINRHLHTRGEIIASPIGALVTPS